MRANTNRSDLKNKIKAEANALFKSQDHGVTHIVQLSKDKNFWAIVLAWMDYDGDDDWNVYGKVGYMPNNTLMAEYDIDWQMPADPETGEVFDTEIEITPDNLNSASDYLVDNWLEIYNEIENRENVEESKNDSSAVSLTEAKFNDIVLEYMLEEGCTLTQAIALAEDTITPELIDNLETTPAYRKLLKDIEYYFKAVDGVEGYRDGDFREGPIDALQDEADFCKDTADFLGSLRFKGFKPEDQKKLTTDTAKDMEYLDRSALRLTNILKKQDDSLYLKPDGSVNVNTNQKPGEYARRALRKIRDLFKRLGKTWAYDPDFDYKSLPDVDYKNYVLDSKNWKQGIQATVNTAMTEGILSKQALLSMEHDLNLNEEQAEYFRHYVFYMME